MVRAIRDENTEAGLIVENSSTGAVLLVTGSDLTNAQPAHVAIVDGSGNQITSFGGGTQYTEGDTDASITGTAMLMEGAANTLVAAQGTAADGLLVNLGSNNDISGTVTANLSATDNAVLDNIDTNTGGNSKDYIAAPGVNEVTKASAGVLVGILVGDAVASSIIEISDHASDGDGNVVFYLAGDTIGPAYYPINTTMSAGITSDITNQTHVTIIYR